MAISTIGGATSSSSTANVAWHTLPNANAPYIINNALPIGVYRIRAFATAFQSTPIATVVFLTTAGVEVSRVVTVDNNSADSFNPSESVVLITTSNVAKYSVSVTGAGIVSIENVGTNVAASLISVLTFSSSQTVTVTGPAACVLIGGGGGGQGGASTTGGGGGSGYLQKFSVTAGSYPLVIGAGGAGTGNGTQGATGGASTFAGFTANGGIGGTGTVGGAGGSGGGVAGGTSSQGGFNGSSSIGTPGNGSGVTFPYWTLPQMSNTPAQQSGSLYAGGGGGSGSGGNPGATQPNTGGGGASAGNNGAAGGNGVLLLAYGA